ncbi:hypothetical protein XELAEV_18010748mg [Xenopus laevis]|uniref:Uncharacterized protein n=1 Tax=Xenopus laevis TaxID=8355 RepID=A0A974DVB2_XENLA|nr:hypothetical protein XELAEV_18010748mg [Xenopus laevis]
MLNLLLWNEVIAEFLSNICYTLAQSFSSLFQVGCYLFFLKVVSYICICREQADIRHKRFLRVPNNKKACTSLLSGLCVSFNS